jgi:hypothetical protein
MSGPSWRSTPFDFAAAPRSCSRSKVPTFGLSRSMMSLRSAISFRNSQTAGGFSAKLAANWAQGNESTQWLTSGPRRRAQSSAGARRQDGGNGNSSGGGSAAPPVARHVSSDGKREEFSDMYARAREERALICWPRKSLKSLINPALTRSRSRSSAIA